MKNLVTLGTCAYIFHWSNDNYSWSKKEYERKCEFRKRLCPLYDIKEEEKRTFEYVMRDGKMFVTIDGLEISINDKMMQHVEGEYEHKHIINGRTFKNPAEFVSDKWHTMGRGWLHHNKLKSLGIDMYDDGLMYYRINFSHSKAEFIVSGGKLYFAGDTYKETTANGICNALGVSSSNAKKDITELLNYLTA